MSSEALPAGRRERGRAAPATGASTSTSAERVVVARGLGRRYGDQWALADVDLDLERGEILGFIGPNGAGKSTFLKLLAGP